MKKEEYQIHITTLSSIVAGSIARLFVHPSDTIKAKLQVMQQNKDPSFSSIRSSLRYTLAEEGIRGLYKGLLISIAGSAPAVCLYFTTYEYSKQLLLQYPTISNNPFLAFLSGGMLAETVACLIFVPIDVIKERLQVQSNLKIYNYAGGIDAAKQIYRTEGVRGVYRAYGATVCSFGPFSALYFMFYEYLKYGLVGESKEIGLYQSMFCAATAGSVAGLLTNPLDMAKVRMQVVRASTAQGAPVFPYKNMFHGIYHIYKTEGFLALYQGSLARIMFHTPNTAIVMGLVEYIRPWVESKFSQQI